MPVNAPLAAAARIAARAGESDDDANAARITRVAVGKRGRQLLILADAAR